MELSLNSVQARGLATFFFDIAKGLVLGGIGFTAVAPPLEIKMIYASVSAVSAFGCIRMALSILEESG